MQADIINTVESFRLLYLKNFLIIFGISIVLLTIVYFRSKNNFPIMMSIALFLNLGSFMFFNQKYQKAVKENLIPTLEKKFEGEYVKSQYLTAEVANKLNIFDHDINSIKSYGYFKTSDKIIEFTRLSFVKKDTEENERENLLFNGKVVITSDANLPEPECRWIKNEYFEAGEKLKKAKPKCKVYHDGKYYYLYNNQNLFSNFHLFKSFRLQNK